MPRLPARFAAVIVAFAPLFVHRSWRHAQVLLIGAVLAPGRRTVTSLLRITGFGRERRFVNYHRVLNRAVWSARAGSRELLGMLLDAFASRGPVVLAIDDTIERRRGKRIQAKGIYRDPVRSSDAHFVKASGLRWVSVMLLAPIPWAKRTWAKRTWALPFLTALAPSERFCREHGRRHKKLTDWGRQLVLQARRWLPGRDVVLVANSGFAALEFLAALRRHGVVTITRLRLDAALYEPAPVRAPSTIGHPRTKGARLPNLTEVLVAEDIAWQRIVVPGWYGAGERVIEISSATAVWRHGGLPIVPIRLRRPRQRSFAGPDRCRRHRWVLVRDPKHRFGPQALLCTGLDRDPEQIVRWFVQRWRVEVTFQETRAHLGIETQRQWSERALARTTPCLLALFSIVTLLATQLSPSMRRRASNTGGTANREPPSVTPWPVSGGRSGVSRVCSHPGSEAIARNAGPPFHDPGATPSAMPPQWPKSS